MNEIFPLYANKQVIRLLGNLQRALHPKFNRLYGILITLPQRLGNENSAHSLLIVRLKIKIQMTDSGNNSMVGIMLNSVPKMKGQWHLTIS